MEINKEILAKLENLDKNEVHNYRYAISIQYILKYFPDVIDVLEIGEITNFTTVLHLCTFKTPKKLYKDYIRSISMNEFLGLFSSSYQ